MKNKSVKSQEEPRAWGGPRQMTAEMARVLAPGQPRRVAVGRLFRVMKLMVTMVDISGDEKGGCPLFWQPSPEQPQEACWCNPYQFSFRQLCGPLLKAVLV